MSLIRAGGLTALILAALTTATLTAFGHWYTANTTGEMIGQILLWLPISLIVSAPVALIIFPVFYALLGIGGRPSPKHFAMLGGIIGAIVAGYALFRFRGSLAVNPSVMFIALPLLVAGATLLGMIGGFLFERMARRAPQPIPPIRPAMSQDAALPGVNPDDLPPAPPKAPSP